MKIITRIGGVMVGWFNATWPFAKLTVNSESMVVKVAFSQNYFFTGNDIVSIEKYGSIPIFSSGIKINHIKNQYNKKFIFLVLGSPKKLIKDIHETGFLPSAEYEKLDEFPTGFPIKWPIVIFLLLTWNVLFVIDISQNNAIGVFSLAAMVLMTIFSWVVLSFPSYQQKILRPGHSFTEVEAMFKLSAFIMTLLSIGSALQLFFLS